MKMELRHQVANGRDVDLVATFVVLEQGAQHRRRTQELITQGSGQFVPFGGVGFRDKDEPAHMGVPVQQKKEVPPLPEDMAVRSQGGMRYE
jgi:hypothetical protein